MNKPSKKPEGCFAAEGNRLVQAAKETKFVTVAVNAALLVTRGKLVAKAALVIATVNFRAEATIQRHGNR